MIGGLDIVLTEAKQYQQMLPKTETWDFLVPCVRCKKIQKMLDVPISGLEDYVKNKKNVQDAFPEMEPDKRELLISGICPECWKEMWGGEDG